MRLRYSKEFQRICSFFDSAFVDCENIFTQKHSFVIAVVVMCIILHNSNQIIFTLDGYIVQNFKKKTFCLTT